MLCAALARVDTEISCPMRLHRHSLWWRCAWRRQVRVMPRVALGKDQKAAPCTASASRAGSRQAGPTATTQARTETVERSGALDAARAGRAPTALRHLWPSLKGQGASLRCAR